MAGEVGHVVYAARLLTYLDKGSGTPKYWAGTLFPDIRHLGVVSRHRTHPAGIGLHSVAGQDDFQTGLRVHAWVDATRQKFLEDQAIKELLPWHPFVPHALKLAEDELLYAQYDDWGFVQRALNKIQAEELAYCSSKEYVQRWHTVLQEYFKAPPSDETRLTLSLAIGLSEASAQEVNNVVQKLLAHKQMPTLLEKFQQRLEGLLR